MDFSEITDAELGVEIAKRFLGTPVRVVNEEDPEYDGILRALKYRHAYKLALMEVRKAGSSLFATALTIALEPREEIVEVTTRDSGGTVGIYVVPESLSRF